MDPRTKDAIRATSVRLEKLEKEVAWLKEHMAMELTLLRAIKESVVRKYGGKK